MCKGRNVLLEQLETVDKNLFDLRREMEDAFNFTALQWKAIDFYCERVGMVNEMEKEIDNAGFNVDAMRREILHKRIDSEVQASKK
jgi:hypothetical protein